MDKPIITVTEKEELEFLYDNWAMTWEGLREEDFQLALKEAGNENSKGYVVKGEVMNKVCHLHGNNAYPDDLTIFAIYPFEGLAMMFGARWMADIVDNNARRERWHPFEDYGEDEDDD